MYSYTQKNSEGIISRILFKQLSILEPCYHGTPCDLPSALDGQSLLAVYLVLHQMGFTMPFILR